MISQRSDLEVVDIVMIMWCLLKAASTFVYITVLSVSGERLAVRMRQALFDSLLQQDISFFDNHKTGELVGR